LALGWWLSGAAKRKVERFFKRRFFGIASFVFWGEPGEWGRLVYRLQPVFTRPPEGGTPTAISGDR
jgi:hypothetical protein